MKVLILASSVDTNRGPDGFIADWVRVLGSKVDKLTVLTYNYSQKEKLPANTKVIKINGNNFLTRNIDLVLKVFGHAKENDVIFAHILEIFGIVGGLMGKITGKKSFLWYCQGYNLSKHLMAKTAFLFCDKILTASEEIKKRYASEIGQWSQNKIMIVGHGIYLPHYRNGLKKNNKITKVLYAGRISPIKDVPTLQKAVAMLKHEGIKIDLVINGLYSYTDNPRIFKSADIMVVPTLSRSLDKVFLEGLVCGVPTIGTDTGYPFMIDKYPELVFRAGDSQDLALKIKWLIDSPQETTKIMASTKKFVQENFDLNKLMDKIVKSFENEK